MCAQILQCGHAAGMQDMLTLLHPHLALLAQLLLPLLAVLPLLLFSFFLCVPARNCLTHKTLAASQTLFIPFTAEMTRTMLEIEEHVNHVLMTQVHSWGSPPYKLLSPLLF